MKWNQEKFIARLTGGIKPDAGDLAMMFLLGCIAGILFCFLMQLVGTEAGRYIYDCARAAGGLD